jgi:hypothetical protein
MPADTKPTTLEEAIDYARRLEDELAAVKKAGRVPHAITPATSRAIADRLQGKVVAAVIATPATPKKTRVLISMGGYAFVGQLVDIVTGSKGVFAHVLLTEGNGTHAHPMLEVVPLDRVVVAPEGW